MAILTQSIETQLLATLTLYRLERYLQASQGNTPQALKLYVKMHKWLLRYCLICIF
jgi:hypothetical protein